MNNPMILKTISISAFIISGIFTTILMGSGTVGFLGFILAVAMAIILEVTKCGFFFKALVDTSLSIAMRSVLCAISLLLVLASIFASAGYVTNQANKAKNQQVKTSTQFKQANESREIQKQLFEQKKLELAALQENKTKTVADMERIRDSYPKNYITVKENMQSTINKKSTDLQTTIDKKSAELAQVAAALQSPIDTTKLALNDTKGYSSMFKVLAEYINKSDDFHDFPIQAEELELWFFIGLGVIFELVAVLTAFLSQKESLGVNFRFKPKNLETCQINNVSEFKPQKFSIKKQEFKKPQKAVIGFKPETTEKNTPKNPETSHFVEEIKSLNNKIEDFNDEDLRTYLDYMYKNVKEGNAPGYIRIGRETGIGVKKAEKIKAHLEMKGIVKVVNNRTKIMKEVV